MLNGTSTRRIGGRCGCSFRAKPARRACASVPTAHLRISRGRCPRATPGAALDGAAARAIAEKAAQSDWGVDFEGVQADRAITGGASERARRPRLRSTSGEREQLGEGRFRLRLGVAGDLLTEVSHFVHVPEAFGCASRNALRQRRPSRASRRSGRARCMESAAASSAFCGCCASAAAVEAGADRRHRRRRTEWHRAARQRAAGVVQLRHRAGYGWCSGVSSWAARY